MNKKLFKSIREYKKESILAPILVILEVLMEVLIPLEMAKIIDVGIANGDLGYIVQRGVHIGTGHTNDNRYYKYPDGIHDEYPPSGKGTDHDTSFLDHDPDDQCKGCPAFPGCYPASWRNTAVYCKKGTSAFYKGI